MRWIALSLVAVVAACSSDTGPSPLKMAVEAIKARGETPERPKGKLTPPRAAIEARGQALVQMNLNGNDAWPILQPSRRAGESVLYLTQLRQGLFLEESLITGTRGLGLDLLGVSTPANDPLKTLTPPDAWPTKMTRTYRFPGEGLEGRVERFECVIKRGPETVVTIAGTPFDVVTFAESCAGADGSFLNAYAADKTTGRVWISQQYIGAGIAAANLEILEPLTE